MKIKSDYTFSQKWLVQKKLFMTLNVDLIKIYNLHLKDSLIL